MQSNRIQHFLYTNNHPKGLNYETGMLWSLVYHEGAEYPHLPTMLPSYVGNLRDSLTKMMADDAVSSECMKKFKDAYCNYEQKLADVNEKIRQARDTFVDDSINAVTDWIGTLRDIFPIPEMYENFINSLAGTEGSGSDIYTDPNYLIAIAISGGWKNPEDNPILAIANQLMMDLAAKEEQYQNLNAEFSRLRTEIRRLEQMRLRGGSAWGEDSEMLLRSLRRQANTIGSKLVSIKNSVKAISVELLTIVKNNPNLFGGPGTVPTANFRNSINFFIKTLMSRQSDTYFGGENYWRRGQIYIPSAKDFLKFFGLLGAAIGLFIAGLKLALIALGVLVAAAGIYAIASLLAGLEGLKQKISQACERWERTVRPLETVDRYRASSEYYQDLQDLLDGGCCDKDGINCNGASGDADGGGDASSGSGGSHGGGSSCTQGVGLTLLMGNKYIPTYYDNIDQNYFNKNTESVSGEIGFKDNCPPMFGAKGSPDCTECGTIASDEQGNPTFYPDNSWKGCSDRRTIVGDSNEPNTPNIPIQAHTCGCGWPKGTQPPEPTVSPCDLIGNLYQGIEGFIEDIRKLIPTTVFAGVE
jgi:uncharacterized membrane protein YgcG